MHKVVGADILSILHLKFGVPMRTLPEATRPLHFYFPSNSFHLIGFEPQDQGSRENVGVQEAV